MKKKLIIVLCILQCCSMIAATPTHASGLTLSGDETETITTDETITGDITLSDNAVLTISGATVTLQHDSDAPRANITLTDNASLIITNGAVIPPMISPDNLYLTAFDTSSISMTNAAFINVIDLVDSASIVGNGARVCSSCEPINISENDGAFGIVQVSTNATATFTDSTIGSFALMFGPSDEAELSNLNPQLYDDFDLQRDATTLTAGFNVSLHNTTVLPVQKKGPFERSWAIFVDPLTHIRITDSSLNKLVFQQFENETVSFHDLELDTPTTFDFRDVHLANTTIANEWGFFGHDSNVSIKNAKGVWLWPMGTGLWKMTKSQMIEFDPRGFTGRLHFSESTWANAGEIFEDTDMQITGSLRTRQQLDQHLVLSNSRITRKYKIHANDAQGKKIRSFSAAIYYKGKKIAQGKTTTGTVQLSIPFSSNTYTKNRVLRIRAQGKTMRKKVTLFSETPLQPRIQ